MADALPGSRTVFKIDFENGLGTLKGTTTPKKFAFVTESLTATQNLIRNPSIRSDGNRPVPVNGNVVCNGQIQIVADLVSAGWLLKWFFHSVTETGAGPYTHTYKWDISSVTFQSAVLDMQLGTSIYKLLSGLRVKKLNMKFMSEGFVLFTLDVVGLTGTYQTSATLVGTTTDWSNPASPFHMLQAAAADMSIDAVAATTAAGNAACLREIEIDANVNITEDDYRFSQAGARSGLSVGALDLDVKMKMAVESATQLTFIQSTSTHNFTTTFTVGASQTLQVIIPAFTVRKTLPSVTNDMGIFVDVEGIASYDNTTATSLKMVLVNSTDGATLYI